MLKPVLNYPGLPLAASIGRGKSASMRVANDSNNLVQLRTDSRLANHESVDQEANPDSDIIQDFRVTSLKAEDEDKKDMPQHHKDLQTGN
ncbi:hypothetical protein SNE40_016764 [Patella caerulea]|uniref:Uncharacterized protein n=1 Tax=Patella caerulea TaxID=87958 RepID=A0AAN8JFC2_PATCE